MNTKYEILDDLFIQIYSLKRLPVESTGKKLNMPKTFGLYFKIISNLQSNRISNVQ